MTAHYSTCKVLYNTPLYSTRVHAIYLALFQAVLGQVRVRSRVNKKKLCAFTR